MTNVVPPHWRWFPDDQFGLFIHWGPYSAWGRGEQVLFREHLDQRAYADAACGWKPAHFGFCLWDSKLTDYSSAFQAAGRDFVRPYVKAFRARGLRAGLYYSLADWRVPAYWDGPAVDPAGWSAFREYVHVTGKAVSWSQ